MKQLLAHFLARTRMASIGRAVVNTFYGKHVRVLNYHGVEADDVAALKQQLKYFAERFHPIGLDDLRRLHAGEWPHSRPGLILSFDDGLKSVFDHAIPVLEAFGFCAWVLVPTQFVSTPVEQQASFAKEHRIGIRGNADRRLAMSWDELRDLDRRGHLVGSHTMTHCRFSVAMDPALVHAEVFGSKERLERELGHPVGVFAWVGGEEHTYTEQAARQIAAAGYEVVLQTNSAPLMPGDTLRTIDRTNVEAWFEPELVELQLSGLIDIYYWPKRKRVRRTVALN